MGRPKEFEKFPKEQKLLIKETMVNSSIKKIQY